LRLTPETAHGGRLAFPGKMKPLHRQSAAGDTTRHWAVADAGHQQIVLLDQQGQELRRIGSGRANLVDGGFDDCCFRTPQGLVCDHDRIYVADTGNHAVRLIDLASEQVTTLAGLGHRGPALPDAAPGRQSALASPWDLELDGDRLYIANAGTHQLALLTLGNGILHRLAGDGGEAIDDGPAAHARLAQPSGLTLSPDRRVLYFADSETSAVRALTLDGIGGSGAVETLVGRGLFEFGHANGDFAAASLQHPLGLCWYDGGLLVADSYNNALRRLDLTQRTVSDFDGGRFLCHDPICLPLGEPAGVTADGDQVFVVDTNNHRILRYLPAENRYDTWFA
jgi:sugar lactone lactonase YvrE